MFEANETPELAALAALQREAHALAIHLQSASDAASSAKGTDSTGRVLVALTANTRVEYVRLERDWRRVLPPADLEHAVLAAYEQATEHQMTMWTTAVARPMRSNDPPSDQNSWSRQPSIESISMPSESDNERISEAWHLLHRASSRLHEIGHELREGAAATATGQDRGRHVAVSLAGGRMVSVHFEQRWLVRAGSAEIGDLTTEAVLAA